MAGADAWDPLLFGGPGGLSNSDKTIDVGNCISFTRWTSGKKYAENTYVFAASAQGGISSPGFTRYVNYQSNGTVDTETVSGIATLSAFVSGDVIGAAVDFDANLIWFRLNGGDWNDNPSANPATGTGGIAFSSGDEAGIYASAQSGGSDSVTLNTGPTFAYGKPSGFDDWYGSSPPAVVPTAFQANAFQGNAHQIGIAFTVAVGYTVSATAGSYSMGGQPVTLRVTHQIVAAAGSYAMTGTVATLKRGRPMVAAAGSYSMGGQTATLRATRRIVGLAGSYAMTGVAASLERGFKVVAVPGSYSMSGQVAALRHAWRIVALAGSYAMTGVAATLKRANRVVAVAGSYSMNGTVANLKRGLKIAAAPGAYTMSGTPVDITKVQGVAAGAGSYAMSGQSVGLTVARLLSVAAGGSYVITGTPVTLTKADVQPLPDVRPPGGGSTKRKARARVKTLRDIIEEHRKRLTEDQIEEVRAEAVQIAEAEGIEPAKLIEAETLGEVLAGLKALTKKLNSEVARIEREEAAFQKAREAAIQAERERKAQEAIENERLRIERREALFRDMISTEELRIAAERQENEEIAIALLLAI